MAMRFGRWLALGSMTVLASVACGDDDGAHGPNGSEAGAAGDGQAGSPTAGASAEDAGAAGSSNAGADRGGSPGEAQAGADQAGGRGGVDASAGTDAGGNGGAGADTLPGARTFSSDGVLEVHLTLDDEVWADLEAHGNLEEYVNAAGSVHVAGGRATNFAELGLRHKGAYSLHHCWDLNGGVRSYFGECAKLSYKLKFNEYDKDGEFDGLKRLNLHASSGDATHLRELIAYQTFRDAGVDGPRAMPARLYINDEFQGLFIAVEEVDGRFAKAHYPDGADGNVFKEIWPNAALTDEDFEGALETNEDLPNVDDMRAFASTIAATNVSDFLADITPHVAIEPLLRYIAVDRLFRNWDGITAFYSPFTPHNFYWYHDSGPEDRFHLVPWDLDNTLWSYDPYMYPEPSSQVPGVPDITSKPLNCDPRVVWSPGSGTYLTPPRCDKLLDLLMQTSFENFAQIATTLRETALSSTQIQALADHYREIIAPIVAEDPTLDALAWSATVDDFANIIVDAGADFDALVAAGLIEEPAPPPDPDAPTQEELDAATLDDGLHVGGITNFEFADPPVTGVPIGIETFGDGLSTLAATWSTTQPLSGAADLLFDFTFARSPLPYDEWVNLGMFTGEVDVTSHTGIVVLLASNKQRNVRIRVYSPVYDESFGGIWSEFGVDRVVGPTPTPIKIDFAALQYPPWARAGWTETQGFPGTDEEAKALVLSRFEGLILVPEATLDGAGEMVAEAEPGWLRVDNLYFR